MPVEAIRYGLLGALAILLLMAAFTDLKSRTISNWLNLAIALGAPLFWWVSGLSLWPGVAMQFGVALAAFVILAGLFAAGAMGGGDVKMLTALALWFPPLAFAQLTVVMALLGGVLTLVFWLRHKMRRETGQVAIPYGVAISCAALWTILRPDSPIQGVAG